MSLECKTPNCKAPMDGYHHSRAYCGKCQIVNNRAQAAALQIANKGKKPSARALEKAITKRRDLEERQEGGYQDRDTEQNWLME